MKKSNRKGFTIVELVIVIAVIAILAAVLIPTFASIIKKANLSSDQSAVRNMNTALAADTAVVDAEDLDLKIVIDALDAAGFNAKKTLVPISSGYTFYWYKTYNKIVLAKDGEVVYPVDNQELVDSFAADLEKTGDDQVLFDLEGGYKYVDVVAKDAKALATALKEGNEKITLSADVTLKDTVPVSAGSEIVVDLAGHKLDASKNGSRPFELYEDTTLIINGDKNSKVICGKYGLVNVTAGTSADITLNGGVYEAATDNGAFIKVRATDDANVVVNVNVNDVTYKDSSNDGYLLNTQGFYGKLNLNIKGGTYEAQHGFAFSSVGESVIDGATINVKSIGVSVACGKVTVKNCTITTEDATDGSVTGGAAIFASNGASATVENTKINTKGIAYYVPNTTGTIVVKNCTATAATEYKILAPTEAGTSKITIDGVEHVYGE